MACERLRGDELVILRGLSRGPEEVRFHLPGELPRMSVRPPGSPKAFTPEAVLQTVKIDTEKGRVSMVWCGAVRLVAPMTDEDMTKVEFQVR